MNYETNPIYDTDIILAFRTGLTVPQSSRGLVYQALKKTSGVPTAVAGVYLPGAIVQNVASGVVYRNSGSTASPAWATM